MLGASEQVVSRLAKERTFELHDNLRYQSNLESMLCEIIHGNIGLGANCHCRFVYRKDAAHSRCVDDSIALKIKRASRRCATMIDSEMAALRVELLHVLLYLVYGSIVLLLQSHHANDQT